MLHKTVETHFQEQGSLPAPGPIGRLVRLGLGVFLLWALWPVLEDIPTLFQRDLNFSWGTLISLLIPFWLLPYVINIGWRLNTKRLPQMVVAGISAILIAYSTLTSGEIMGFAFVLFSLVWVVYVFLHLGLSFVLAALLATPGCEMRAIPHLWTKITGSETAEHSCHECPGFLDRLDGWERKKSSQ